MTYWKEHAAQQQQLREDHQKYLESLLGSGAAVPGPKPAVRFLRDLLWWVGVPLRLAITVFVIVPLLIWPDEMHQIANMVRDLWRRKW